MGSCTLQGKAKAEIRFNYDGRVLKDSEVPADVDMEDDDIVDCYHDPSQSRQRTLVRERKLTADTIDWSG